MNLRISIVFALVTLSNIPARAGVRDIHRSKLPQSASVLQAYDDLAHFEPYARDWAAEWKFDVPKDKVRRALSSDLSTLTAAQSTAPDNLELMLLTGLAAHYAYTDPAHS